MNWQSDPGRHPCAPLRVVPAANVRPWAPVYLSSQPGHPFPYLQKPGVLSRGRWLFSLWPLTGQPILHMANFERTYLV